MASRMWMIRAGESAYLVDEFRDRNLVAVGWNKLGDLTGRKLSKKELVKIITDLEPELKEGQVRMSANQFYKFMTKISAGDYVISYDPNLRKYLIGKIKSEHLYKEKICIDYPNYRKVEWLAEIDRDRLSTSTKNTLGAISTLFEIRNSAKREILGLLEGKALQPEETEEDEQEIDILREDVISRANEFIKDKLMALDWQEMENLVAGILRAMGFKTRITDKGPDRGRDIIASPDGLGLENPRILVEVKHRNNPMGSNEVRSFIGTLRSESKGLYVSTGGFTKEAKYEADRSNIPITLIDSTELVNLILQYYDNFDNDSRALIPLVKVYWPA